jgi:hypothetical protein
LQVIMTLNGYLVTGRKWCERRRQMIGRGSDKIDNDIHIYVLTLTWAEFTLNVQADTHSYLKLVPLFSLFFFFFLGGGGLTNLVKVSGWKCNFVDPKLRDRYQRLRKMISFSLMFTFLILHTLCIHSSGW